MTSSQHAHAFDTGPLSWVIGEIRDALERSGSALNDAATRGGDAQPTLLLHAKTHLHQAHGALLMVDVEGVGVLTGAAERALDAFKEDLIPCTLDAAKVVQDAYGAIGEYLDELVAGSPPQPARLFSYYRALEELLGAERIHPSDLLLVDTSATLDLPPPTAGAPDYAQCRAQFEKALLPYMKSPDDAARRTHAASLGAALAPLLNAGIDARARTFWSALHSVATLVASGQLPGDLYIKQLFSQVNLQLRRLTQGQAELPDALLRDALFFIAATPVADGDCAALRHAFRLDGAVPPDYAERRYGKVDPGALKEAKEALARSKSDWDQLAVRADDNYEADFNEALATLAGASDKLGAPALAQLLRELGQAASDSIASGRSDQFGLEMATAMLFVEQSLDQVRKLPADFDQHAEVVGQRLLALAAGTTPPEAPHWQNELTRQTQQGQTVAVLAGEIKSGLRYVEKLLDEYYDEPQTKRTALQQGVTQLHQVEGALSILDQDAAARAAQHVRAAVAVLAESDGDVQAQAATLHNIARNIGALGFFVDMLAQNSENARNRFVFDAEAGLLRELSYEQLAALDAPAAVAVPVPEPVADTAADVADAVPQADVEAAPQADVESTPAVAAPAAQAETYVDAELLGIFIEEADEVLGVVAATLPELERNPGAQDALTIVRRAFHTLKGSARMVDLNTFGTTAAALERVLNVWLADARAATPDLLKLVAHAHAELAPWVAELAQAGHSNRDGLALIAVAERVQAGEAFVAETVPAQADEAVAEAEAPVMADALEVETQAEPEAVAAVEAPAEASAETEADIEAFDVPDAAADSEAETVADDEVLAEADAIPEDAAADAVTDAEADAVPDAVADAVPDAVADADNAAVAETDFTESDLAPAEGMLVDEQLEALPVAGDFETAAEKAAAVETDAGESNIIALPTATRPALLPDDGMRRVGTLDIPLGLYNIYVAETDELLRVLERDFGEWRHEPGRPVTDEALKAVHTLAGTSSTVGFLDLLDLAQALETTLEQLAGQAPTLQASQHDVLEGALANVREMLQAFSRGELAPADASTLEQLATLRDELTAQHAAAAYGDAEPDLGEHLDFLFEQTYDSLLSDPPVFEAPVAAQADSAAADSQTDDLFGLDVEDLFDAQAAAPATTAEEEHIAPELVAELDEAVPDVAPSHIEAEAEPEAQADIESEAQPEQTFEPALQTDFEPQAETEAEAEAEAETESVLDAAQADETGTEPEPAPAFELEHAAEPVTEAQAEAEQESVAEAEVEAEAEAEAEIAPEALAQPESEFAPALEAEPEPEPEPEAVVEAQAEALPEPELESQPEPVAQRQPEAELETEAEAEAEAEAEIAAQAEVEPEHAAEAELEAEPQTELQAQAEQEPEPVPHSAPELDFDSLSEAELELLTRPDAQPQAVEESAAAPQPEPVLEVEPQAETQVEAEAQTQAETQPEPQAEPQAESVLQLAVEALPVAAVKPDTIARPLALDTTRGTLSAEPLLRDDLDADLLPIFLEEAADLLPQIGNGLRQWQHNPADPAPAQGLLRTLHTVKGSARMAGAMRIGQHTHELETLVENMVHAGTTAPAAFDELMANYDQALALFEQLVQPAQAGEAPAAEAAQDDAPITLASPEALAPTEARTPLVRVRADILDRLVTQAGEVSITRSRLENQMGVLKGALADFSDNLARLSRQLREVEMQAESQIASRMSIAGEREFDPLEFDRFTRLQELTRMMAESVNDVGSFHESLSRTVDGAGEELAAQSRLTRDLQRDLMRVRMVPFASLSERLFRVARQTAKETDKRVNLDIRGGGVEIDRSVLEQMAAPFEHLLRNAIVHGVEPRAARVAAGKQETGELLVQVSQQGNEVILQFSDDGAGLDLDRIRAKARQLGLVGPDVTLTDAQAAELIFESGFSTADVLTELAGRGVGMDVVRAEAQALGGRVTIATEAGHGARFTIRLPLTLAVTQVVLVSSAGKTYALPSTLVEQVHQIRETELASATSAGVIQAAGEVLPFHYLPALLGEGTTFEPGQRSRPVLVLQGAGERGALQVDEVLGNREVVIKNLGPQLARVPGIAGATVLGTGEIVLILNPLALGRHAGSVTPVAVPAPQPAPVHRPTVMVVDDSLTVRRVTQRLLEREGFRVVLAKDGVDALEQLPGVRPDLMLVDIEMPRMDGFDLVRHVRNDAVSSAVPIIMITSRTADKHRNYALGLGVNAYFGKPFQENVLLGAIAGLLGGEMPAA